MVLIGTEGKNRTEKVILKTLIGVHVGGLSK